MIFSKEEYLSRLSKVTDVMEHKNMDVIIKMKHIILSLFQLILIMTLKG